jgi:hypothetical protein
MKLLREPLLHFLAAGAVLFGAYAWLGDSEAPATGVEPVRIGSGEVKWLTDTFSGQWMRPPDAEELQGLIFDLVKEELLAREAREMGLEESDTIVRRRLAQKLEFLVEDTANIAEPPEADLRKYYEANISVFHVPGKVSFRQIYFNPEGRNDPQGDATALLATLGTAEAGIAAEAGDRFLLGSEFEKLGEIEANGMFGEELSGQIFDAPQGKWSGPFKSGYGYHLIQVTERTDQVPRPFEEAREAVLLEWLRDRQEEISRDYLERLSDKYRVVYDEEVTKLLSPERQTEAAPR